MPTYQVGCSATVFGRIYPCQGEIVRAKNPKRALRVEGFVRISLIEITYCVQATTCVWL